MRHWLFDSTKFSSFEETQAIIFHQVAFTDFLWLLLEYDEVSWGRNKASSYLRIRTVIPLSPRQRGLSNAFVHKQPCSRFMSKLHASQLGLGRGKDRTWVSQAPLWETPFSPRPLAAALPRARQLAGGSEELTTCLPTGARRVTVPGRMTGEKKNKNSIFQSCWACCYGDELPPSSVPLNLLSWFAAFPMCKWYFLLFHIFPCSSHILGDCPRRPLCFWANIPPRNMKMSWFFMRRVEPGLRQRDLMLFNGISRKF